MPDYSHTSDSIVFTYCVDLLLEMPYENKIIDDVLSTCDVKIFLKIVHVYVPVIEIIGLVPLDYHTICLNSFSLLF